MQEELPKKLFTIETCVNYLVLEDGSSALRVPAMTRSAAQRIARRSECCDPNDLVASCRTHAFLTWRGVNVLRAAHARTHTIHYDAFVKGFQIAGNQIRFGKPTPRL